MSDTARYKSCRTGSATTSCGDGLNCRDMLLLMQNAKADVESRLIKRKIALSVWENEGGRALGQRQAVRSDGPWPYMIRTELTQLRIRVIALENLVISLLAATSDCRLDLAREMAAYISPRPGFTRHPLTINAAAQMIHLVELAGHFRVVPP